MKTAFLSWSRYSRFALVAVASLSLALSACQPENTLAEEDEDLALTEIASEASFEEVDAVSFEALDATDFSAYRRSWAGVVNRLLNSCATISHDSANNLITVDFGSGCTGTDGKVRAGKILIQYTQRLYIPGAMLTISLDSFYVDNHHIEGVKTMTNVSPSIQSNISLQTTLDNGKVTWPDGSFATREFDRTSTWVRANNPINDELIVDGSASGTRRNGVSYTASTLSPLKFRRACRIQGIRMAVEGSLLIQRSNHDDLTIDFGTGDCDRTITLTMNGQSQTITLN
jgi:hypothetical protein